jgi:hypothetical protein
MPNPTFDIQALAAVWGPRLVAAVVALVVAAVVGVALKWALAKAIDRIPVVARFDQKAPANQRTGANLGQTAYWLVLLIGVVAALNTLQLGQVAAPLNTLLGNVFAYLPNVAGAALILFIGYVVASLVRRLTTTALGAAQLDRLIARTGISGATQTGAQGLSGAIGTLLFVLILIPVAIAALQALRIEAISTPAIAVLTAILAAIPNIIAAGVVLGIGVMAGLWIETLVARLLPAVGVDQAFASLARLSAPRTATAPTSSAGAQMLSTVTPSQVLAKLALVTIVAFAALEAARLLSFAMIAAMLTSILELAGRIIFGGAIIGAGVMVAGVLANLIVRTDSHGERMAGALVRWAAIALSVAMGLRFMGIADEIVILAFGLTLGAAAVATALAFGLGGREAAGDLASDWVEQIRRGEFGQVSQAAPAAPLMHSPSEPRSFEGEQQPPASP